MKRAYIVICYKEENTRLFSNEPNPHAGDLYFCIDTLKAGENIKSRIDSIKCEYMHLCESKKEAEDLRAYWMECEQKNRAERQKRKNEEREKMHLYHVRDVRDDSTRVMKTTANAYEVAQYVYKSELYASPNYKEPRALVFNENYFCTYAVIYTADGTPAYIVQEVTE